MGIEAALESSHADGESDVARQKLSVASEKVEDAMPSPVAQDSKAHSTLVNASPQASLHETSTHSKRSAAPLLSPRDFEDQRTAFPDATIWEGMHLPVEFSFRPNHDRYTALASVPSLKPDTLKMTLSNDRSTLTISGLCVPTNRQAKQMQHKIARQIQQLARVSPHEFLQLREELDQVIARAYEELGEGRYGRFSQVVQVPADVDTQRIKASFDDGVLGIMFPRRRTCSSRPLTARYPYDLHRSAGLWGHPAFGW